MKKKIILFCLVAIILFGFASSVFALNWPVAPGPGSLKLDPQTSTLTEMIEYFYRWAIVLGGLAAFVMLLYAGFQYLTSTGDPTKTKDARDRIGSAIGGLVLLLASFILLNIVNPELTGLSALSRDKLEGLFDFTMGQSSRMVGIPPCEKVIVYNEEDFKSEYKEYRPGDKEFTISPKLGDINQQRPGSLEIIGNCTAALYPTSNGLGDSAQFSFSVSNLNLVNPDGFGSLRVISNIEAKPAGAPTLTFQACVGEGAGKVCDKNGVNIQPRKDVTLVWGIGGFGFESCQTQSNPSTDQWDSNTVVEPTAPGQKIISGLTQNTTFFLTCLGSKDKTVISPPQQPEKVFVSVTETPLTKEDLLTVDLKVKGNVLKTCTKASCPNSDGPLIFPSDFNGKSDQVTFTWTSTTPEKIESCTGEKGLSGERSGATGSATRGMVEIPPVTGKRTFTISCIGKKGGTATDSVEIEISI